MPVLEKKINVDFRMINHLFIISLGKLGLPLAAIFILKLMLLVLT